MGYGGKQKLVANALMWDLINLRAETAAKLHDYKGKVTPDDLVSALNGTNTRAKLNDFARFVILEDALVKYQNKTIDDVAVQSLINDIKGNRAIRLLPSSDPIND